MLIATDVWIFYIFKYISNSKLLLFSLSSKETHNIVHNYVVINKNHVQKIQKSKKYEQRKTLEHILEFAIEDHKFVVSQLQKCFYQFKNKPQLKSKLKDLSQRRKPKKKNLLSAKLRRKLKKNK